MMISKALASSVALILLLSRGATSRRLQEDNVRLGSISGQVTRDSDRTPLAGAVIQLLNGEGVEVNKVTTGNNGRYRFRSLRPDEYTVVETNPRDYPVDIRPEDNKITITLAPGRDDRGNDFIDSEETDNTANEKNVRLPDVDVCFSDEEGNRQPQITAPWSAFNTCNIGAPGEVVNFHIECKPGGTYLAFQIADVGIPSDHWQLKGKIWDKNPNTAVTTSPGPVYAYSVPGRVYTYGPYRYGTGINALVECSYLNGVNVFPAGAYVYFRSDADGCTVNRSTLSARIDRSP